METNSGRIDSAQVNKELVGEAIRIFSILPYPEKRSLLVSFSQMADESVNDSPLDQISLDMLTCREQQVLVLVAHGYSRREIGVSLRISANTAARHIANIYRKLDISTSAEAAKAALAAKLIT